MQRDKAVILDICHAADALLRLAATLDKESLKERHVERKALLYDLLVIGEAVKRLSKSFVVTHPEIPWALIARMRDKLIHDYDSTNLDLVWTTVTEDIPDLRRKLANLLET
jgi:uncharacterized protein with HEPN domain